jgi:hypothetical protein
MKGTPMADEVENTPVKRGPGRPRKVAPEPAAEPEAPAAPFDPNNPQVGQTCDPTWSGFGHESGFYRCENGVLVEKVAL